MSLENVEMWEAEYSIESDAKPEVIWALFADVSGWRRWNAGIEKVELLGAFAAGTRFLMTPPGQETLTCRLIEVRENVGFLDETCVGGLKIFVEHDLAVQSNGRTKITYSLQAFGPGCSGVGPAVSADFPEVLKALVALAECDLCVKT